MTTPRQRRENQAAQRSMARNQSDLGRLDAAERDLNNLPPAAAGSPEEARRQRLRDAIRTRRDRLNRQNQLLQQMIDSEDGEERANLRDQYEAERDAYHDTSGMGGGRAHDPCVPCRIEQDIWDVVEVLPTTWTRQYVNLDGRCRPRPAPPEQHGRTITVSARIAPPRRGKTVHWTLHTGAGNRTQHFSQAAGALPASHAARLSRASSTTNAHGIATVTLTMGLYGGDQFQVSAAKDPPAGAPAPATAGTPRRTAVFEVWRKLWYGRIEMTQPGGAGATYSLPAASIAAPVGSYRQVFVELLDSGELRTRPFRENFETHPSMYGWADHGTTRAYAPWKVVYSAVAFCVPLANRQELIVTENVTSASQLLTGDFYPYDFLVGASANRRQWFIRASARVLATGATVNLTQANFARSTPPPWGPTRIRVNLAGTGLAPSAASPVQVVLHYWDAPGYNGWGGANLHLVICRASMGISYGAQVAAAMGGTCTHEPGHALGLVYGTLPWRTTNAAQSDHCSVQACVMWFQGYTTPAMRPYAFHTQNDAAVAVDPNCHTFLRGKNLSRSAMHIWRFPR